MSALKKQWDKFIGRKLIPQLSHPHGLMALFMPQILEHNKPLSAEMFNHLKLSPGSRVLEFGFGSGVLIDYLMKQSNCSVVGTDISSSMVRYTRSKYSDYVNEGRLVLHNKDIFSCVDEHIGKFDYICTANTIYYIDNLPALLKNVKNLLMPNGSLVIGYALRSHQLKWGLDKGAVQLFEEADVTRLLHNTGYSVRTIVTMSGLARVAIASPSRI